MKKLEELKSKAISNPKKIIGGFTLSHCVVLSGPGYEAMHCSDSDQDRPAN